MKVILSLITLTFFSLSANAIECLNQQTDFLNLADQFGPHLDQSDTGRCYAYASGKMVEAAIYRTQKKQIHSIDPDILAADYYAFSKSSEMLESFEMNLKDQTGDLFSGGDQEDLLSLLAANIIPTFKRKADSRITLGLKACEKSTREMYAKKTGITKTHAHFKKCITNLNNMYKNDNEMIAKISDLSFIDVYDAEKGNGCMEGVLIDILDRTLCQAIPMIASLSVSFDPGDADNPYPINLFEITAKELNKLKNKTTQNLDENKYSRVNTNMINHAVIVSGKIQLGKSHYYILKNSYSAEFALLPIREVCSLWRAQALVSKKEGKELRHELDQIVLNSRPKQQHTRKPASQKKIP
jgi:hypothetical protein